MNEFMLGLRTLEKYSIKEIKVIKVIESEIKKSSVNPSIP